MLYVSIIWLKIAVSHETLSIKTLCLHFLPMYSYISMSVYLSIYLSIYLSVCIIHIYTCFCLFFFFHEHWWCIGHQGKGGATCIHLYYFHSFMDIQTLASLYLRRLPWILNCFTCNCKAATRWDLSTSGISIWLNVRSYYSSLTDKPWI